MTFLLLLLLSAAAFSGTIKAKPDLKRAVPKVQENPSCHWIQIGEDIDADRPGDNFGFSAALSADGSRLAVGAPKHDGPFLEDSGQTRIFDYNATSDTYEELYIPIYGVGWMDEAGKVVLSSDGQVLAVGARKHGNFDSGHVRVFKLNGTDWAQYGQELKGEFKNDRFGHWVALNEDGSVLAVGAESFDGPVTVNLGLVRIYHFDNGKWQQLGQDILGESQDDHIPDSLEFNADGTILAVGASEHDSPIVGDDSGFAKVYQYNGTIWNLMGQKIEAEIMREACGWSVDVSADGSVLAVTSIDHDGINGTDSGGVRVFRYNSTIELWEQVGPYLEGEAAGDQFGWEVSLSEDGSIMAVGAFGNDGDNGVNSGHVRVFQFRTGVGWLQIGSDIDGEAEEDKAGSGVDLSANGTILAIKSGRNRASFGVQKSGHVRVFRLSSPDCISSDLVEPFDYALPPRDSQDLSAGAIVGSVLAAIVVIGVVSFFYMRKIHNKYSNEESASGVTGGPVLSPTVANSRLPSFKDQVRHWSSPNSVFMQYKDQVRNVQEGILPSTVTAQPESSQEAALDREDEEPQPATAHVLNSSDSQRISALNAKDYGGGAIPIALAVFLDKDKKKPRSTLDSIEEGCANNSIGQISEGTEKSVQEEEKEEETLAVFLDKDKKKPRAKFDLIGEGGANNCIGRISEGAEKSVEEEEVEETLAGCLDKDKKPRAKLDPIEDCGGRIWI